MPNKTKKKREERTLPRQRQSRQPGRERPMHPAPEVIRDDYEGADKLIGRVALITGGDSGIGRSVAVHFAREGADVAIVYLEEDDDARDTKRLVEAEGKRCLLLAGDVGDEGFCREAVERTVRELGRLDVLVNNAAEQHEVGSLEELGSEQLERTFRTNIFGMFHMTRFALPHLKEQDGATIINSTSVTAYRGSPHLLDYSATKGAIVAFTRSLSGQLAGEGVRVNAVAPGPIWTPLIPASFPPEQVERFGADVPLGRPGQPSECGPCYVFLACEDSSYMTGQVLHPNGGEIVNT